jgi:hypothetical protein
MADKLHIIVCQTDAGYYIVNLVKGKRAITLRSYNPEEVVSARRWADELSDVINCGWIDRRRTREILCKDS